MLCISPIFVLLLSSTPAPAQACVQAENYYQNLDVEKALSLVASTVALSDKPLPLCLQIQALSHIVMGQNARGRAALKKLFSVASDHRIDDPSLSPSMRDLISSVRIESLSIASEAKAHWLTAETIELSIEFSGRFLPTHTIRYEARFPESGDVQRGEISPRTKTATATLSILTDKKINLLELSGLVRTSEGSVVYEFSQKVQVDGIRPKPAKPIVKTVAPVDPWYEQWWVWTTVGVLALGGGLGSYLAIDARNPECPSGLGCLEVGE